MRKEYTKFPLKDWFILPETPHDIYPSNPSQRQNATGPCRSCGKTTTERSTLWTTRRSICGSGRGPTGDRSLEAGRIQRASIWRISSWNASIKLLRPTSSCSSLPRWRSSRCKQLPLCSRGGRKCLPQVLLSLLSALSLCKRFDLYFNRREIKTTRKQNIRSWWRRSFQRTAPSK